MSKIGKRKKERDDLIVKLTLDKTKSLLDIAKQFNITRQRVGEILKFRGIKKEYILTPEKELDIRKKAKEGLKKYWRGKIAEKKVG